MKSVFPDTGYLIALELASDQNHRAATKQWRSILKSLPLLFITSYVFDEAVTVFNSRGHYAKAVEVGSYLISSPSVRLIHVEESLFREGWNYFQKHSDKKYSLTDCISFLVMDEFGIETAFAFDKHFVQAGFKKLP